jgi:hypothetical protein
VTQERTEEHKELDRANRRIHELESENEFLKKALRYLWWVAHPHPLKGVAFKRQYFPRQEAAFLRCDMDA